MRAEPRTLTKVFLPDIQYVVPIFQRRYVWTAADQWEGLWEDLLETVDDVQRAETQAAAGADVSPPNHFLGAVVVDRSLSVGSEVDERPLIDGQQRLTTMQVLLNVVRGCAEALGARSAAESLSRLVENSSGLVEQQHQRFKVWPSAPDRDAFVAAQNDATSFDGEGLIWRAREFFSERVNAWLTADGADPVERVGELSRVLRRNVELVVIDLEAHDNAQVIFESLNYGGRELEAIDLVKNHVFFQARHLGFDQQKHLHETYWTPFDEDWWRERVTQGRLYRSRAELFLMHWLKLERLEEIPAHRLFVSFRSLPALTSDLTGTVERMARDRDLYQTFDVDHEAVPAQAAGLLHRLDLLDLGVPRPVLLQIVRAVSAQLSPDRAARALHALDSYFWRRALVGRRTAAYNRTMLDVLKAVDADLDHADDAMIETLATYEGASVVWPDDESLRNELTTRSLYINFTKNGRLAYLLRTIENAWRAARSEGPLPLGSTLQVEHILPQTWKETWPLAVSDSDDADLKSAQREGYVHRLGNLTLVSAGMNAAMSNSPWQAKQGHLREHSTALLTLRFLDLASWDELEIQKRGQAMIDTIIALWPGKTGMFTAPPAA